MPRIALAGTGWGGFTALLLVRDGEGGGKPDILARDRDGRLPLYRGGGACAGRRARAGASAPGGLLHAAGLREGAPQDAFAPLRHVRLSPARQAPMTGDMTVAGPLKAARAGTPVAVARQPILDRDEQVRGYELLYRPAGPPPVGPDGLTPNVIVSALADWTRWSATARPG